MLFALLMLFALDIDWALRVSSRGLINYVIRQFRCSRSAQKAGTRTLALDMLLALDMDCAIAE